MSLSPDNVEDIYELTALQKGMFFHLQKQDTQDSYFEQFTFTIQGEVNAEALQQSWQGLVERHPALRTSFFSDGLEEPMQVVMRECTLPFTSLDWSDLPQNNEKTNPQLEAYLKKDRQKGFALTQAPLMRVALIRITASQHVMVWSFMHLLLDGWCLQQIFNEIQMGYTCACNHETLHLPAARPFSDFVKWLAQQPKNHHIEKWGHYLNAFTEPTPLPLASPTKQAPPQHEELTLTLSHEQTHTLKTFAAQNQLTLNTLIRGAWALTTGRLTGKADVLFGATVSGRPADFREAENMIGMFINTVPVRAKLGFNGCVSDFLKTLQEDQTTMSSFEHCALVDIQQATSLNSQQALFESLLVFENYPSTQNEAHKKNAGLNISKIKARERTNYPLTLIAALDETLSLRFIYDTQRWNDASIESLMDALQSVLEQIPNNSTLDELKLVQAQHAETPSQAPTALTHKAVEQIAQNTPNTVAIEFDGATITYGLLNSRANQLAQELITLGVGPESLVAIYLERSPECIMAQLAVLKAGGAFIPMDTSYPAERSAYMLKDSGTQWLITKEPRCHSLDTGAVNVLFVDDTKHWQAQQTEPPAVNITPKHAAYCIYTSGSTGRPKGVIVTHANLQNLCKWHAQSFALSPQCRASHMAGSAFDASVWEIWPYLCAGSTVLPISATTLQDTENLPQWLAQKRITHSFIPTPLLEILLHTAWPQASTLHFVFTGGDRLRTPPPSSFPARLINNYGPTEATVVATSGLIEADTHSSSHVPDIGTAILNSTVYVLGETLDPLPPKAIGELYIGGLNLGRAYHNQSALTAEHFLPDPFSNTAGQRMYRTGDLARMLPDGRIQFIGRTDRQIKIRGYRIETGEIEQVMLNSGICSQAVVVVQQHNNRPAFLVAYYTGENKTDSSNQLKNILAAQLPEYMMPQHLIVLKHLPLTPNGKIDTKALPSPQTPQAERTAHAPQTPLEKTIAKAFEQTLKTQVTDKRRSFFEMGGHSLNAMQTVAILRDELDRDIPLMTLYKAPTIEGFATELEHESTASIYTNQRSPSFLKSEAHIEINPTHPLPQSRDADEMPCILITGATGFLGAFLCKALINKHAGKLKLYALVRAQDDAAAQQRLVDVLKKYKLWDDTAEKAIQAIAGDLALPKLGVNNSTYDTLASEVTEIFHNGAYVHLMHPYERFKPANVDGTREVISLALSKKIKPVRYVSTLSVLANEIFMRTEQDPLEAPSGLGTGYAQSKWVAEKMLFNAHEQGLPITIFRPGRIIGDTTHGIWSPDDFACRVIRGCVQLGLVPEIRGYDNMTPVDVVAKSIVAINQNTVPNGPFVFHLNNPEPTSWQTFIDTAKACGHPLTVVPYHNWRQALVNDITLGKENALAEMLDAFPEIIDKDEDNSIQNDINKARIHCEDATAALKAAGLDIPPISNELVRKYFDFFHRSELIPQP